MATKRKTTAKTKPTKTKAAPEEKALSAEYRAGYEANGASANVDTCPFSPGTSERSKWFAGWYAADAARHDARSGRKVRR